MDVAASFSPSKDPKKYDVFISFSGEDVRYSFVTHLFKALNLKQIYAFADENLRRGEEISPALLNVTKNSYVSIVIFSKTYPYSTWCLDELAQISECYKTMNQIVIPVFYHVDPSHVQNLQGNFYDAFVHHRQRFDHCLEKVEKWRRALVEISCLSGFVSSTVKSESNFIDQIADGVSLKLRELYRSGSQNDGFFGINLRVQEVEQLLCIESKNCMSIVGIWGMGGIGKTTIADKIYSKIQHNFDAHCFVANVRETLEKRTVKDLRDEIFRQLLGEKNLEIGTPHSLETSVKRRLQCKKVLIVLDDVNDSKQLRLLLGDSIDLFCFGSRILVTSRDSKVFKIVGVEVHIYAVEGLNDCEALKLFSWHAFCQNHPKQGYMNLSKRAIQYAQGIPLALVVLGSNLYDRGIEEWEDELEKVKSIPDMDIQKIMRISYDGLDRDEQMIFLDIACFFKGVHMDTLKKMLQSFGFHAEIGIKRLIEKSLITCKYSLYDGGFCIMLHDLVEQMGREIVVEESNKMVGEQSRLWNYEDIIHVLRNDLGTAKIEGILLNMRGIDEKVEISPKAFLHMPNLRFLKITFPWNCFYSSKLLFPNGLAFLPNKLRYLEWEYYPFKHLPSKFFPHNLVELHMPYSNLKELGNLDKSLKSLKRINLSGSRDLISVDFSNARNLCFLKLDECSSLEEIGWSVKVESERTTLNLRRYKSFHRLLEIPHNIKYLHLDESAIEQLPAKIGFVKSLQNLHLKGCTRLTSLPDSICDLKLLEALNVSDCVNLHQLPNKVGNLQNLRRLNAAKSGIQELPESINQLHKLENLNFSGCEGLKLPPLIGLPKLQRINLSGCHMLEFPKGLYSETSLAGIDLSGNNFNSIPASINKLFNLRYLYLTDCKRLEVLPDLPSTLQILQASNCTCLESVSIAVLPTCELRLGNCINLKQEESTRIVDHVLKTHLSNDKRKCRLYIARSEMPEKMMHKNESGSSLSITLDPNDRLIGFSLCAVLESNARPLSAKCSAILTDLSGHIHQKDYYYGGIFHLKSQSDSLSLWYANTSHISAISKAKFCFSNKVLKCGVNPIFEKPQDQSDSMKKRKKNSAHKRNSI